MAASIPVRHRTPSEEAADASLDVAAARGAVTSESKAVIDAKAAYTAVPYPGTRCKLFLLWFHHD